MRNERSPATLAAALALTLALAGCGSDDEPVAASDTTPADSIFTDEPAAVTQSAEAPPAETSPPALPVEIDACTLLTQAEAETLAGTPLDPPYAGPGSCTWPGPVTGPTAQVEIYLGDGAQKILEIDRQLAHVFTEVPGLGEEAWAEDGMVFALVGGTWIGVRLVLLSDPAEYNPRLEEATRIAAGRL